MDYYSKERYTGYSNSKNKGFTNENILLESFVDKDLVFKANMKSDHLSNRYEEQYEYSNLKFYYKYICKW